MPRVMEIDTPLGDGVLLFHGMQAREEMGRLSEFHLDLLSEKNDISIDDIPKISPSAWLGAKGASVAVTRFAGFTLSPYAPTVP